MEAAYSLRLTRSEYLALPADDRAWQEAFLAERRDTHEACGQPLSQTLAPENVGRWTAESAGECQACMAIRVKSEGVPAEILWSAHLRNN